MSVYSCCVCVFQEVKSRLEEVGPMSNTIQFFIQFAVVAILVGLVTNDITFCQAWYSRGYFLEERYCLDENRNFKAGSDEYEPESVTVKNYLACPETCHSCEFLHPDNSVWCVQKHFAEPEDEYIESWNDDRLLVMDNDVVADSSCMQRQEEFIAIYQRLTGNPKATCSMIHMDGEGHSYFYSCWAR